MGLEVIKLELIEWVTGLDDQDTLEYLKVVKDNKSSTHDWYDDLNEEQRKGIERGLKDVDEGRVTDHDQVKKKYGL